LLVYLDVPHTEHHGVREGVEVVEFAELERLDPHAAPAVERGRHPDQPFRVGGDRFVGEGSPGEETFSELALFLADYSVEDPVFEKHAGRVPLYGGGGLLAFFQERGCRFLSYTFERREVGHRLSLRKRADPPDVPGQRLAVAPGPAGRGRGLSRE